jgi:hypothetical protein
LHIEPTTLKLNEIIQENLVEFIQHSVYMEHERVEKTTMMTTFDCDSVGYPIADSTRNKDPTICLETMPFRFVSSSKCKWGVQFGVKIYYMNVFNFKFNTSIFIHLFLFTFHYNN